jgi:hypothetical protein
LFSQCSSVHAYRSFIGRDPEAESTAAFVAFGGGRLAARRKTARVADPARRGPFRPGQLIPSRARVEARALARTFRASTLTGSGHALPGDDASRATRTSPPACGPRPWSPCCRSAALDAYVFHVKRDLWRATWARRRRLGRRPAHLAALMVTSGDEPSADRTSGESPSWPRAAADHACTWAGGRIIARGRRRAA